MSGPGGGVKREDLFLIGGIWMAMEEQDEGSIGRSLNLSFEESESFFSNGQSF